MNKVISNLHAMASTIILAGYIQSVQADLISETSVIPSGLTTPVYSSNLFLNVVDNTSKISYAVDLGVTLPNFISQAKQSFTFNYLQPIGQDFTHWLTTGLNNGDNFTYNIAAVNHTTKFLTSPTDGILLSSPSVTTAPVGSGYTNGNLLKYMQNIISRVDAVNSDYNISGNPKVSNPANQAYFDSSTVPWGTGESTTNSYDSTTVGASGANVLYAYYIASSGVTQKINTIENQDFLAGSFSIDSNSSDPGYGNLTWTATSVPLNGSMWLFLTTLLALLAVQKYSLAEMRQRYTKPC